MAKKQTAAKKAAEKKKEEIAKAIFKDEAVEDPQKGRVLNYEHFDLVAFKNNGNGVDLTYYDTLLPNEQHVLKIKGAPHPDLQIVMDELKLYFATKIGILKGWEFALDHIKGNPERLKEARANHEETVNQVKITGLSFKGDGDARSVDIKGYHPYPEGGGTGVASGKVVFSDDSLGFEEEVEEICERICKEVYKYKFGRKRAQTDLMQQAAEAEQED